ncbi:uncharacterized protein I303_101411 [Kwoniella dejecticola CBS 10117]|uniref:Uncharacterized protein n=1 Tax=Kwoniella dejecticola CBS 10117 TaxID=1296121 RepID=A0A1A6AHS1_9TREE|nr:uncharacterized protein I303_01420 [Kwoniella dejecticola CBS 10117]OBR89591.1 hypothetical protein I303_01420 [Kwoniella dejecticola CBS 10117]
MSNWNHSKPTLASPGEPINELSTLDKTSSYVARSVARLLVDLGEWLGKYDKSRSVTLKANSGSASSIGSEGESKHSEESPTALRFRSDNGPVIDNDAVSPGTGESLPFDIYSMRKNLEMLTPRQGPRSVDGDAFDGKTVDEGQSSERTDEMSKFESGLIGHIVRRDEWGIAFLDSQGEPVLELADVCHDVIAIVELTCHSNTASKDLSRIVMKDMHFPMNDNYYRLSLTICDSYIIEGYMATKVYNGVSGIGSVLGIAQKSTLK